MHFKEPIVRVLRPPSSGFSFMASRYQTIAHQTVAVYIDNMVSSITVTDKKKEDQWQLLDTAATSLWIAQFDGVKFGLKNAQHAEKTRNRKRLRQRGGKGRTCRDNCCGFRRCE